MKFAAIDIGSNAVRLLLTRVFEENGQPFFKKESLVRIPLRLGSDTFKLRYLSREKTKMLIHALTGFRYLIKAYQPIAYMACATSAMREAQNRAEIVDEILNQSEINLHIIDGQKEAEIIYANHFEEKLDKRTSYLYIDVGGGSTELTLFHKGESIASQSFNIGTIRLLENLVVEKTWKEMRNWIKEMTRERDEVCGIGSGGNINKIYRLAHQKNGKPITYKKIREIYKQVNAYSYLERIQIMGMKPDRAEVIIPGSQIYLSAMKWAKIKKIYVPQIGLADGIIHILYERHKNMKDSLNPAVQNPVLSL